MLLVAVKKTCKTHKQENQQINFGAVQISVHFQSPDAVEDLIFLNNALFTVGEN